jgi:hypothetical protein
MYVARAKTLHSSKGKKGLDITEALRAILIYNNGLIYSISSPFLKRPFITLQGVIDKSGLYCVYVKI